jgi:predicted membrane channel-forming protein YqfA (hemolysin III family)
MRIVIVIMLLAIVGSLTSALFYLMKDQGKGKRTVTALSIRIGLSVLLFLAILLAGHFGWIHSTGIPQRPV